MHASLADVIADTALNSLEANASRVSVELVEDGTAISVVIADNVRGMDAATCRLAFEPSCTEIGKHPARKVGLGLPNLKRLCERCGGSCSLDSEPDVGTTLAYRFDAHSPDLPPLGDVAAAVTVLFNFPGEFELVFTHRRGDAAYSVVRSELAAAVGSLETVEGLSLALEFLRGQETAVLPPHLYKCGGRVESPQSHFL